MPDDKGFDRLCQDAPMVVGATLPVNTHFPLWCLQRLAAVSDETATHRKSQQLIDA